MALHSPTGLKYCIAALMGIALFLPTGLPAQGRSTQNEGIIIDDRTIIEANEGFTSAEKSVSLWCERERVKGAYNETLLEADVTAIAPDLLINPQLNGWYSVYVGTYTPDNLTCGLFIRGTKEPHCTFITGTGPGPFPNFSETFYKNLDMTGQSLLICQPLEYRSAIDYIRFVPLEQYDKQSLERLRSAPYEKDVIGIADFWRWFYLFGSYRPDNAAVCIQEHADYGFNIAVYELGESCMSYNTAVGTPYHYDSARQRTRIVRFQATRNSPLKTAVETAHQAGIKLYGKLGMNSHYGGAYRGSATSNFAAANPGYWERKKDGTPDPARLCYGFKQVRQERIDLFLEALEHGVDGLCIDILRYPPMIEYGKPVVAEYIKLTGIDAMAIDSSDTEKYKHWVRFRSEYFTAFMRELRDALRQKGHKDIPVMIMVSDEGLDKILENGVDLSALVREQLVTGIIASSAQIEPYLELVKGTGIKVYGGFSIQGEAPAGTARQTDGAWPAVRLASPDSRTLGMNILDLYEKGSYGVALYESEEGVNYPELRPLFQYLKSAEILKEFLKKPPR